MQFIHNDLGYRHSGEIVEITLTSGANVRLLDSSNFSNYKNGRNHKYIGGLAKKSPIRLQIPNSGHWHVAMKIFKNYPKPDRPVDFVLYHKGKPIAIGLARYDSDRGGAQEDDRTGQYRDCAQEILTYSKQNNLNLKVIFLNDGPGLLLGSMWKDYSFLEDSWDGLVKVVTLRMVTERITMKWLLE